MQGLKLPVGWLCMSAPHLLPNYVSLLNSGSPRKPWASHHKSSAPILSTAIASSGVCTSSCVLKQASPIFISLSWSACGCHLSLWGQTLRHWWHSWKDANYLLSCPGNCSICVVCQTWLKVASRSKVRKGLGTEGVWLSLVSLGNEAKARSSSVQESQIIWLRVQVTLQSQKTPQVRVRGGSKFGRKKNDSLCEGSRCRARVALPMSLQSCGSYRADQMSLSSHQMQSDFIFFPVKLQIDPLPCYLRELALTAENYGYKGERPRSLSLM